MRSVRSFRPAANEVAPKRVSDAAVIVFEVQSAVVHLRLLRSAVCRRPDAADGGRLRYVTKRIVHLSPLTGLAAAAVAADVAAEVRRSSLTQVF